MGMMEGRDSRFYHVTSESVTEDRPDKMCDQIIDGILGTYLEQGSKSRVAIEAMASADALVLAGGIISKGYVNVATKAREIIRRVGYTGHGKGFGADACMVFTNIRNRSPDISVGVIRSSETGRKILSGGDQGIIYDYAVNETGSLVSLPYHLANHLAQHLDHIGKILKTDLLYPGGGTQITMRYNEVGRPVGIRNVVVSVQYGETVSHELLNAFIRYTIIESVIDSRWLTPETRIHMNPTGRFIIGGLAGDTGVTGEKTIVDTYGTVDKHGGDASLGKGPTKVGRSVAYMARYVAKNIVAAGLVDRCGVTLAYVIRGIESEAVAINTFGTGRIPSNHIEELVKSVSSSGVSDYIEELNLRTPRHLKIAAYGYLRRDDQGFRWEETDRA